MLLCDKSWSGPDFLFSKIRTKIRTGPIFFEKNWSGPDFFILKKNIRTTDRTTKKSGPVRIIRTK